VVVRGRIKHRGGHRYCLGTGLCVGRVFLLGGEAIEPLALFLLGRYVPTFALCPKLGGLFHYLAPL
jgi:hypothetical protein